MLDLAPDVFQVPKRLVVATGHCRQSSRRACDDRFDQIALGRLIERHVQEHDDLGNRRVTHEVAQRSEQLGPVGRRGFLKGHRNG
jgi:hypothetical protein